MISFLFAHWYAFAPLGVAAALFLGIGLVGGWALVLNPKVLGLLALVGAATLAAVALDVHDDRVRAEGAAAIQRANDAATAARRKAISEYVVEQAAARAKDVEARLLAEQRLDLERANRQQERKVSYAKADAACVVPVRFVRDHDATVPRPGGRADVSLPGAGDLDAGSGVPLSAVAEVVDRNYTECQKLLDRTRDAESRRYRDCVAWDRKYATASGCSP